MAISLFNKTNIPLLGKALDAYALRQKVTASNIANISTVGYRSQTVTFEDELAGALQGSQISGSQTNKSHMPIGVPSPMDATARVIDTNTGPGIDNASGANDVDIDLEMAALAKDQMNFRFAARIVTETFRGIQKTIRGQV
ncbi:MAG TPA: flagellar basal body rod protein FlgB [Bacteroidetes bacterium]|jgi:flagellar basal-body rod protein FlgB|nr:flagellar basal body rod protein FlgB [Bacteroidota bacterium]